MEAERPQPIRWATRLDEPGTAQQHPHWPLMLRVSEEFRASDQYFFDGATRADADHVIVQYTIAGSGWLRWRGREFAVPPGSAFIVRARDPDLQYGRLDAPYHLLYATLIGSLAFQLVDDWLTVHDPVVPIASTSGVLRDLRRMQERHQVVVTPGFALGWLTRLLIAAAQEQSTESLRAKQRAEAALQIMHDDPQGRLSVAGIARQLALSREQLTRDFTQALGVGPHAMHLRLRLERALRRLVDETTPLAQIALDGGWNDLATFSRTVKRHTGQSPRALRQAQVMPALL